MLLLVTGGPRGVPDQCRLFSGSYYRFNKKTTIEECRSLDIRRLHREGLLEPGRRFSW
jgi:hypothetical protein